MEMITSSVSALNFAALIASVSQIGLIIGKALLIFIRRHLLLTALGA